VVVASDEEQCRNGKSLPVLIGEHRGAHDFTLLDLEASAGEDVFVHHFVDRRPRFLVADAVRCIPVEVSPDVGATGKCGVEDGTG
jgi:hypothetical protein